MEVIRFRHIGIVVKNLDKQLYFYNDLLGLEIYYHETEKGKFLETILNKKNVEADIYKLGRNNNIIVELLHFSDYHKSESKKLFDTGLTHFAITVDSVDKIYKKLIENKVKFISFPELSVNGKYKVCFCRDFEGNLLELVEEINK